MALDVVIKQIITLFTIVIIGFYGRKRDIIDEKLSNGLSKLLLEIANPLLIISSFSFAGDPSIAGNMRKAFIYGAAVFILTPIAVKPFFIKVQKRKRNILQFAMIFSNCGFMGFPLTHSVLGDEGIIYASIFNMFFTICIWTYGVMLFNDTRDLKQAKNLLTNPGIISSVIGILIMAFSIQIPAPVLDSMKLVGGVTTPVSMLIIGSLLASTDFSKALRDITIYYGAVIKLLLIPAAFFGISVLFNERSVVMKTFILMQAMPAGAMTSLFAENFDREKEYAALIVSFTTLLSMVTLPLIIRFFL